MKFKMNEFNREEFNREIYNIFSGAIDVESEEINRLRQEIELLRINNRELRVKSARLERENQRIKNNPKNKKISINKIKEFVEKEYTFLSEESKESLISAEYLFLNENENIDYSGVYIGYIKLLEIELRGKLSKNENMTFGSLITKLEEARIFNGLVKELNKNVVIDNRNRGAHSGVIKKIECGKIRKILIEEGWLRRVVEYFNTIELSDEIDEF